MQKNPDAVVLAQCAGKCPAYLSVYHNPKMLKVYLSPAPYIMYKRAKAEAVKRGLLKPVTRPRAGKPRQAK